MALAYVASRARSFGFALRGLVVLARESHSRVHAVATVLVLTLATVRQVSKLEVCALALAIVSVWVAEALNTAVERLADAAVPRRDPLIAAAKDVAASAVLLAALGAAVVGGVIFWP